jgi:hypothetical protein
MSASSLEKIWLDICGLSADHVRAHMIETVLNSQAVVRGFQQLGVYGELLSWLSAFRRGTVIPFPYNAQGRPVTLEARVQQERWSQMYNFPTHPVSPSHSHSHSPSHSSHTAAPPSYQTYAARPSVPQRANTYPQDSASSSSIVIHPAAKAMDFFQESLALLGIDESEALTHERISAAYKRAAIRAHPDKGGSKEQFDALRKAYQYIEKIVERVSPRQNAAEKARMSATVSMETAMAHRAALPEGPPIEISAKKMDMAQFNRLFEEHRLPDPDRDTGYGDWIKSQDGSDDIQRDPRLQGKFNQTAFESVFREKAMKQSAGSSALMKRTGPQDLIALGGTELGGSSDNFTAAFGADTQFADLKQAYTTGSTVFQEVADVRVAEKSARSIADAKRIREEAMSQVDPDENARITAYAMEMERKERERRMRLAKQDQVAENWAEQMKRRLVIRDTS